MSGSPDTQTAYQEGVLHGFVTGLALAQERRKALRLSFFKSPARNERRLLMNFVSEIKDSAYGLQGKDTAFAAGMIDSLDSWIESLKAEIKSGAGRKYAKVSGK